MERSNRLLTGFAAVLASSLLLGGVSISTADVVPLKNPTATLSQSGGWNVSVVTDNVTNDFAGWAIYDFNTGSASAQTAVFETETNVGFATGSALTFALYHVNHNPQATLGRFRLSYTTDARDTFADGLNSGGDVTASWTVLSPKAASATDGAILSILEDGSILASGANPTKSVYTVAADTLAQGITGFRLEALEDPSLPTSGPGRAGNGNFVLTEMTVEATVLAPTNQPPPDYSDYVLSRDFSPTNNPSGAWSYGAKPSLDGAFSAFGIRGLNPFEYWQLVASQEPTIYRNGTSETINIGGQGIFPPGTVFLYSGTDGATNPFGVVRFTVPSGGSSNYLVQTGVRPVYDGGAQGDTDFHVVRNGTELFGQFLAPADGSGYTNTLSLLAGDTLDFMVGRGLDNSGTASGLKIDLTITPTNSLAVTPRTTNSNCAIDLGITGWWPLDGDAVDTLGGNSGVLAGTPTFMVGRVGPGMLFDGVDDSVRVASSSAINVGAGVGFTLEAWINPADLSHLRPIAEWNSGAIGVAFWTGVDTAAAGDGERSLFGNVIDTSGISHQIRTPKHLVVTGEWQHVAITYDKASGASSIYYNGLVVAATNLGTFTPLTTGALNIGNRPSGSFAGIHWKGGMDEVSLYGRSLVAAEIQAIYDAGAEGKCSDVTNGVPPWIIVQPQGQVVIKGNNASLSVVARGSSPLQYQWRKGDADLADATNATLALAGVTFSDAGPYSVVVNNDLGSITSVVANVVVNLGPSQLRVISVAASAEGQVELPVELVANGNENAIGFSLTFNPALLTFTQAAQGETAIEASLIVNTNDLASGRLGIALALPADAVFPEGIQQLVRLSFEAVSATQSAIAQVGFGDQPVLRQVSDVSAAALVATYSGGSVSIEVTGLEADVAPRPGGNNSVTIIDWVQVGRYVAALDSITNNLEFQKADSAPRAGRGNGVISVSDWVQAGRYAAGLDLIRPAGGPLEPAAPLAAAGGGIQAASGRVLMILETNALPGTTFALPVWLESTGNENALAFTLSFDPASLQFLSASKLGKMSGATLNVNTNLSAAGKIGIAMALPTGTAMAAGLDSILLLNFAVAASATGSGPLSFGDSPVFRDVADVAANSLASAFNGASVTFGPPRVVGPPLTAARSGNSVLLFWPSSAQGFEVYSATSVDATNWIKVPGAPFDIGGRWLMTAPVTGSNQFFRLEKR